MSLLTPLHQSSRLGPDWLWLPGWSFSADIFLPLAQALPGNHLGLDYQQTPADLSATLQQLSAEAPANAIWVGWSLGGALAHLAAPQCSAKALVTLATSPAFCSPDADADFGLDADLLQQFIQGYQQAADKTLRRFLALCTQGASDPRTLIRTLQASQLPSSTALEHSLRWLQEYHLPSLSHLPVQQHWYGPADALNARGLQPARYSPANSHAFFVEDGGQAPLIQELRALAAQVYP
jgi:malonyl-CoA O-methyltransferase